MSRPQSIPDPMITPSHREALKRVLASQTFARSEKSQKFLKFVAELTFRGDESIIHEHLIAVEVFGRGDDYSSGEDSVVRRQAHALRRKLKDYYEGEGRNDEIQIELPVGSYVPVFRVAAERGGEWAASAGETDEPAQRKAEGRPSRWMVAALACGAVVVGAGLFRAGWVMSRAAGAGPRGETVFPAAVREIWGAWLSQGSHGAVLCFSNPPTTSVRQFSEPLKPNPEHQGIGVTATQDGALRRFFGFPTGGHVYLYPLAAQAKMGEALAAVSLASFFTRGGLPVRAMQSRLLSWETMRQENVILLGHADSNRWIEPVLKTAPFNLAPTDAQRRARIVNLKPLSGEQAEYFPNVPDGNKSYALVSMLTGMDGTHEILVLGGLDTSSTTAAAEYLLAPETAGDLLRRLKQAAPGHEGPWRFQVILETDVRDTVPLKAFPVALRVL